MYGMTSITTRQREIADFIDQTRRDEGSAPSFREIARHFGFKSVGTVVSHVRALRRKGIFHAPTRHARSLRVRSTLEPLRKSVVDVPLLGVIPAGFAEDRKQDAQGCISMDIETLGIKPSPRTFALQVRGDSMIGRCILDGDLVVLEHGMTPRSGDVVAALIDNESTLKTFLVNHGKPFLRAENPKYPDLIPAHELVIQGVVVALVRRRKG
ncbi:MAG: repressor LexA [Verrucomicrobiota bacterium]|jgi:repressor LexA